MADSGIKLYDAKSVVLTVDGVVIQGFQDNDMITYSFKEEQVRTSVDAQGVPSLAKNNNHLGNIVINLSGNSKSHKFLNNLANTRKVFPIVIKSDLEKVSSTQCIIAKPADGAFGKDTPKRTYTVEALSMEVTAL
ncbi:hypothetical protein G7084_01515 [Weissella coleopterorum]|uniref:DUF3277 family protein n=1 Tax=Weissella coleopterorum TaxID=2714949 RepID=A0A6G8AYI1_9LACO|nr:hypothetical protein [Weissella coleopterorum]QIL50114.1 hypothetical protein G7084_01515 [Weissella coleopterorum]